MQKPKQKPSFERPKVVKLNWNPREQEISRPYCKKVSHTTIVLLSPFVKHQEQTEESNKNQNKQSIGQIIRDIWSFHQEGQLKIENHKKALNREKQIQQNPMKIHQ